MKDLIKVLIALSFMVIAFFVGQYIAQEKCDTIIKELNNNVFIEKELSQKLHDSIAILIKKQVELSKDTKSIKGPQPKKKHK
jgi:hypothetical protein